MTSKEATIDKNLAATAEKLEDRIEFETVEVEINKVKWKLYREIPYTVSSKIMAVLVNSLYNLGAKMSPEFLMTMFDEIVMAIVVEPRITREFLKSPKCPAQFGTWALEYFIELMSGFKEIIGIRDPNAVKRADIEKEEVEEQLDKVIV